MASVSLILASVSTAAILWTVSVVVQDHGFAPDMPWVPRGLTSRFQKSAEDPVGTKQLVFAIKNRSVKELEELLLTISDPASPSYGDYLTLSELRNLTYNAEGYEAVMSFLRDYNVNDIHETINRDFVIINIPTSDAERMLATSFTRTTYHDASYVSAFDYTLPKQLTEHVDFVGGVFHRASWRKTQRMRQQVEGADLGKGPILNGYVSPALLNQHYHIYSNDVERGTGAALFEALGQSYSQEDLFKFQDSFGLPHEDIDEIIGPNTDGACRIDPGSCGEANLDVQYFMAIAQHARTTYWSINANDPDPFLSWIVAIASDDTPPLVHSISYGGDEREEHSADRFNQELIKLGLRGITVVVSSGDDGANSPQVRQDPSRCGMSPSFPASSPFVVAVGATQGPESGHEEVACSSRTGGVITSGGGFSTLFRQPHYQRQSVHHYLDTIPSEQLPSRSDFNTGGRGYPDVSLLGYNYLIFDNLKCLQESGTSASAPVFAAMLTLINDELIKNNLSPVGFINPVLYSLSNDKPDVFFDIVKGENRCAAGYAENVHCCDFGFLATKGWDPVTGLGSVQFARFKKAIIDLKKKKQLDQFSGFFDESNDANLSS